MNNVWNRLKGRQCKFVLKDGGRVQVFYGTVIDANDSFIVETDRYGRLYFLRVDLIEKICEVISSEVNQSREPIESLKTQ